MIYPGQDFSTFARPDGLPDMDLSWLPISGGRVLLEAVARRLITAPGMMDDPTYGIDLRTYLNATLLSGDEGVLQAAIRAEALKVDGVDDAQVDVTLDGAGGFTADVGITLSDDDSYEFAFVLDAAGAAKIFMPAS